MLATAQVSHSIDYSSGTAGGMCQVWRGEGVRRSGSLNGITLH
jgi:hypothetical protein